jgi:hypothetical protein
MHRRYRDLLAPILRSFVYASEEAEPEVIGDNPDPDLCVLVDPWTPAFAGSGEEPSLLCTSTAECPHARG